MADFLSDKFNKLMTTKKNNKKRNLFVIILAVIVAAGTVAGVHYNGVAMSHKDKVLTCSVAESGTPVAHTHNSDCYDADGNLVCTLPEAEAHTHTEDCYDEEGNLICGMQELPVHVHSDACFTTVIVEEEPEQVAEVSEQTPEETAETAEVSTIPAAAEEAITAGVSNPAADVEDSGSWAAMFAGMVLTEDWDVDFLNIALSQRNYTESGANYVFAANGEKAGYSRYGAWAGHPYDKWDAAFVSFCLNYAKIPTDKMPRAAETVEFLKVLTEKQLVRSKDEYVPVPGDLVFFDMDQDTVADRVVIVSAISPVDDVLQIVGGDIENTVREEQYSFSDARILSYAQLPKNPAKVSLLAENDTADLTFQAEADGMTVSVYAPEGAFPEGTTMVVTPIYDQGILDTAAGLVTDTVKSVQAVDITFYDAEGNAIEPAAPIKVTMTSAAIAEADDAVVVHVDNEGAVNVVDGETGSDTVAFESDAFSVYVIIGTESLTTRYITAEGDTYTITVFYGPEAELPEGAVLEVRELGSDSKDYTAYVEQVAKALAEGEDLPFVNAAKLFDISIMADGQKVEPKAPVEVRIEYVKPESLNTTSEVAAVHFKDNLPNTEAEVLDVNVQGSEGEVGGVSFSTDSFSIYAIVIIDNEAGTFVFEDEDYKVTITYTKEANIPIGTELIVREITDVNEYDKLWDQTIEKINEGIEWTNPDEPDPRTGLSDAVFFDISLNYEGKEFEPEVPLGVKIEFKTGGVILPDNEEAKIVHFAKSGIEIIDNVVTETVEENLPSDVPERQLLGSFEYQQDGFSPVGAVTTGEFGVEGVVTGPARALSASGTRAAEIGASKTVTDPDGDGVYELALSVTGSSQSSTVTQVDKTNVVIIVDVSGSMTQNCVYTPYTYSAATYSNSTTYYRNTDGDTVWHWPGGNYGGRYRAAGWYRGSYGTFNTVHTGTVYTRATRLAEEQAALKQLVNALLSNNRPEGTIAEDGTTKLDDIIEITLIKFAYAQETNNYNGTSTLIRNVNTETEHAQLDTIIDNLWAGGGTNWESALKEAQTEANRYKTAQSDENVAIIFLTDGVPTSWGTTNTQGSETANNTHTAWNNASDDARALIYSNGAATGYTLYNIFAFGTDTQKYNNDGGRTDADYLRSLTNYAYTGTGTYANTGTTQYVRDYFFNASDTQALTDAFQKIIDNISDTVGYGGVDYTDGVTVGVTNTSVTVDGTVNEENFRYTVRNGTNIVYTVKFSGNTATFNINGADYTDSTPETVVTKIDEDDESTWISSEVYSVEVGGKTYMMSKAQMNSDNGLVDWDLAGLGILENGYTYTVAFDVWPNQFSYDIVADLNNHVKTLADVKAELIASLGEEEGTKLYDQIVAALQGPDANGQYSILTNWEQKVSYYTVETEEDDQGHSSTTYTQQPDKELAVPDPIALTSKPLPMTKVWNSNLSPDQIGNLLYEDYPANTVPTKYQVTLHVWKADTATQLEEMIAQYAGDPATASEHDYIEKTLGWRESEQDYVWTDDLAIAPGTMVSIQTAIDMGIDVTLPEHQKNIVSYSGAQYYIIEIGHYYYVTEDQIDWHFELETVIYHPMMVNGRLKNVTFITDAAGNVTGIEDIEDMTQVTATNSKTAELDITKKVVDNTHIMTQEQMDAETFTYKITLTVPVDADMTHTNALEWVPRYDDDVSASNRYYIYGYQTSEDPSLLGFDDDVARFNGKVYGQYTVSYPGGGATLDEIFSIDAGGTTKSGTIYVTLKQNEVIRFTNLPSETQYRIEEMYNNLYQADPSRDADANLGTNAPASNVEENGYAVTIATKNGSPSASGRVVTGTIEELNKRYYNQFTNTLDDTAVVDLSVTKHLQGYEWTGERYYVKLAASDENTPLPRITTRYLSAASGSDDVTFNFGSVHLDPGTYTYTVTETASDFTESYAGKNINGIIYDSVKTIIVTVADDLTVTIDETSSDGVTYNADTNTINAKVTNKLLELSVYKFGGTEVDNKLSGVQFKLYSDEDLTEQVTVDARNNPIGTDGVITTGADGTAPLGILAEGTYYLVETGLGNNKGYNMLTEPVEITVGDPIHYKQSSYSPSEMYTSASDAEDLVKSNGGMYINYAEDGTTIVGYTFTINNKTGVELPNAGGIGINGFMLLGIALAATASALVVLKIMIERRRETVRVNTKRRNTRK